MGRRDRLIRQTFRSRFLVTMHSGEAFDGLLEDADEQTVVLVDAWAIERTGRTEVDGRLYLPRTEVAYLQQPKAS